MITQVQTNIIPCLTSAIIYYSSAQCSTSCSSSPSYAALQVYHPLVQFYTHHSILKVVFPLSYNIQLLLAVPSQSINRETFPSFHHLLIPLLIPSQYMSTLILIRVYEL